MTTKTATAGASTRTQSDKAFATCNHEMKAVYEANKEIHGPFPFYTAGPLLFPSYVDGFKTKELKAEVNCRACAEFIERHGRLAFISEKGEVIPALFDHTRVSGNYRAPIKAVESIVRGCEISSLAYFDSATLGRPMDGGWEHLSIRHGVPKLQVKQQDAHWAEMKIAQEHHKNLTRSIADFNITLVRRVLKFIQNESLRNGDKIEGWAKWLERIYVDISKADVQRKNRENIIWRYVAYAPAGWCEVRGSSIGKLLKNLKEGMDDDDAIAIFDDITREDKHQRPTAAPTEGNINQAERLVEAMGLAPSLHRRFCGISEFPHIWDPKTVVQEAAGDGVFGALRKGVNGKKVLDDKPTVDATTMTWAKFAKKILPEALKISMLIPHGKQGFGGFLTAVNPDAPALFKWDSDEDNRNPVSSYVHNKGSTAAQWSLIAGTRVPVLAISVMPWMLNPHIKGMGEGVMLVLEEAQDQDVESLALFPSDLLSALHPVRATIEAFSNEGKIQECPEDQLMSGYIINNKASVACSLRVTTSLGTSDFIIDRWE